jgi:hypothetical protein
MLKTDRPMITCLIVAYNEADRISLPLAHARQWADEVLVVDKSSTDRTAEIAVAAGARVEVVPFTRAGHEDTCAIVRMASHDWVWLFTAGEVPTRQVIEAGKRAISDDIDAVAIPHLYYSFGIHHEASPWSWSGQLRLIHRGRASIQNVVHASVSCDQGRLGIVPAGPGCFVLHQTHATAQGFMRMHVDYMAAEAAQQDPLQTFHRAIGTAKACDQAFEKHPELSKHQLAWKIYWYGVALHALERHEGRDVPSEYAARAAELCREEWGDSR